ncbi:type III effector protein [Streptomyces sp. NPDC006638]|uniref:type III effector protein n=1 Tax=unclassified Streptomyces TaxID=2593676 RepID=UPI0033A133FD
MTAADQPDPGPAQAPGPASFLATAAALEAIDQALRTARSHAPDAPEDGGPDPRHVLDTLLLLRRIRDQLAAWESGLVETARGAGASWADLAEPLGVASRQAAERRYLRQRPGAAGSTGEQRVRATRDRRAADRGVTAWARDNGADLRGLAGQITALTDLPVSSQGLVDNLHQALADNDPTTLLAPLAATAPSLRPTHPELADRVDALTDHTDRLHQGTTGPT